MPLPWSGLLNGKIINLKMTSFDEFVTATKALGPIYLGFAGVILFLLLVLHLLGASPSAKAKRKAV